MTLHEILHVLADAVHLPDSLRGEIHTAIDEHAGQVATVATDVEKAAAEVATAAKDAQQPAPVTPPPARP